VFTTPFALDCNGGDVAGMFVDARPGESEITLTQMTATARDKGKGFEEEGNPAGVWRGNRFACFDNGLEMEAMFERSNGNGAA